MTPQAQLQTTKVFNAIPPGVIKDNAAFVSNVIDTAGISYGEFHTALGALDIAAAVFKVQESDTKTNDTTLGGTPADVVDVTTKPAATDDNGIFITGIDLTNKSRKRYIQLQVTGGDGSAGTYLASQFVACVDGLSSNAAADRGAVAVQYV